MSVYTDCIAQLQDALEGNKTAYLLPKDGNHLVTVRVVGYTIKAKVNKPIRATVTILVPVIDKYSPHVYSSGVFRHATETRHAEDLIIR